MKALASLSMLHERPDQNSATRRFRDRPVLHWTLTRLAGASGLGASCIICFDDQRAAAAEACGDRGMVHSIGPRRPMAGVDAYAAARRWSDGWRGGLLNSTEFDLGFDGAAIHAVAQQHQAEAVILIDPAAAMIDPDLISRLVQHSKLQPDCEFCFLPAAPGFAAMLLRMPLLTRLASAGLAPGRLVTYQPEAPMRDPLAAASCVDVPLPVARTLSSYKLNSRSQVDRLTESWSELNGQLLATSAERLIAMAPSVAAAELPRDVVIELNTERASRPLFSAVRSGRLIREPMSLQVARQIFEQLARRDDTRVTFAGVGDPLQHPELSEIIQAARQAGIAAIHVETDLLTNSGEAIDQLAQSGVDVVSVHVPAILASTYAQVMGVDALPHLVENIKRFLTARGRRGGSLPILAPTFVKLAINLAEMESWYDQWLKAVGSVVIVGPSTLGGVIEDVSVGDMSPPARVPCRRLGSRMTILSDGRVVSCEEDVMGANVMGDVNRQAISEIWRQSFGRLRVLHADRRWDDCTLCRGCHEWHRP